MGNASAVGLSTLFSSLQGMGSGLHKCITGRGSKVDRVLFLDFRATSPVLYLPMSWERIFLFDHGIVSSSSTICVEKQ